MNKKLSRTSSGHSWDWRDELRGMLTPRVVPYAIAGLVIGSVARLGVDLPKLAEQKVPTSSPVLTGDAQGSEVKDQRPSSIPVEGDRRGVHSAVPRL